MSRKDSPGKVISPVGLACILIVGDYRVLGKLLGWAQGVGLRAAFSPVEKSMAGSLSRPWNGIGSQFMADWFAG
ncbi:hypothetical protein DSLASN_03730 [Desulfoluna limicola]|uniref:Uncharacterized protein n=1 Tax=Desulfoluna limicola TaxID=2810562 RepID=A0ABN6EZM3_9BACT|nr:hypothetical protein DSLASN_03730 [Desulfoluna limicola]